jgi:hypothetical protein
MAPVRRSAATTDALLARAMLAVGDNDPETIARDTGTSLHFDATRGASLHRTGLNDRPARDGLVEEVASALRDKAIEEAAEYAERFAPTWGALGPIATTAIGLGESYNNGVEKPHREGDVQRALAASDAGVVALANALDLPPSFQASVAQAHPGSTNVAAAMTVALKGDPCTLAELRFRADQGLVDAAGFAQMAAREIAPLMKEAANNPTLAKDLSVRAAELEKRYLAPVMRRAQGDAAYGLGVQEALHLATRAVLSTANQAGYDDAVRRASANVLSVTPPTVIAG